MMKSSLYFAKTPHLQDLCTVVVKLAISNNQETPTTFKVQPQIIKCRFVRDNWLELFFILRGETYHQCMNL